MRIRPLLFIIATLVLAPAFLAAAIAVQKVREGERRAALEGLRETVRATSLLIDGEVQRSLGALNALGDSPYLATGDLRLFYAQASRINQPPDVWSLLLDANGQQLLNTALPFDTPLPPPRAKTRVQKVLNTGQPLVTDLIVGPATGKLLTTIYVPAKASSNHVVAQAFSVEHWKRTALQPHGRSDLTIGVIDRAGKFIARSKQSDVMLGKPARPELVAAAAASEEGLIRHKTLEGTDSYDAFTHSKLTGWTIAVAAPVSSIEASANQAVMWLIAGVGSALALALAATLFFGRQFVELIDTLTTAAQSLGQGEVPSVRKVALQEVNALSESLGQAGRVLATERASREVLEDERTQLLANEVTAKERAQAENAAKDRFLALLGHELRNPLAAINGATEVLLRCDPSKTDFGRYTGMIKRQNQHLTRIVNDLLEVSRMLSGRIALACEPLNLAECVRACVEALCATGSVAPGQIRLRSEEVWTHGDPIRMEQIINNLLGNAIKFSVDKQPIEVLVYQFGERAVLEVIDNGLGIDADLMPHIFEPFVQGPHFKGQLYSGLGIGLALVHQLVALHHGEIVAQSEGNGCGARFVVTLPLSLVSKPSLAPHLNPAVNAPEPQHRVLLVEDNPDAMEATGALLELLGYSFVGARDGIEALEIVRSDPPDIVLMDIGLPGKDGYQVTQEIRAMSLKRHLPVIALSGYSQDLVDSRSQTVFDACLIKPVGPGELAEAISAQLPS
ncbi:MAG: ATP-binding protein [Aquabacterium sp.]